MGAAQMRREVDKLRKMRARGTGAVCVAVDKIFKPLELHSSPTSNSTEDQPKLEDFQAMAVSTMMQFLPWALLLLASAPFAIALWDMFLSMVWKPLRIKRALEAQGIKSLPFRFISGNLPEYLDEARIARASPMPQLSHDIAPRVFPHYYNWSEKYGNPFLYWFGSEARVIMPEPEQGKEILSNKFGHYKKPDLRPDTKDLVGNGLFALDGEKWAQHRRILGPAFFMEKLKAMTPTMAACAAAVLEKWETQVLEEQSKRKEIDVDEEFKALTADVIAHTGFGSSHAVGMQVFQLQQEQVSLGVKLARSASIPGARFLPTSNNRHRWRLNNQIQTLLRQMIENRIKSTESGRADSYGNDLLGLMMTANKGALEGNQKKLTMSVQDIIEECKNFFFAGQETTATLLTWTLMLLASNPEWQERAREEVLAVCGKEPPHADALNHLKIVGMVLNEALRLYPPAIVAFRESLKKMKFGNILIPEGTVVIVPIIAFHHDPKYWGPDAHEFNPQRFADGIAKAGKQPSQACYMPFAVGPRNCIGQTLAMLEAKVVLSMILQRFSFHLSPGYKHAPTIRITLQPQYGMQIIFEKLADS